MYTSARVKLKICKLVHGESFTNYNKQRTNVFSRYREKVSRVQRFLRPAISSKL